MLEEQRAAAMHLHGVAGLVSAGVPVWDAVSRVAGPQPEGHAGQSKTAGGPFLDVLRAAARAERLGGSRADWLAGLAELGGLAGQGVSAAPFQQRGSGAAVHASRPELGSQQGGSAGDGRCLAELALCLRLGADHGIPAAETLELLAGTVQSRVEAEEHVQSALAGPEATARLLLWLPAIGAAFGVFLLGGAWVDALLSLPGLLLAAAGLGLILAGRRANRAILARAREVDA